MRPISKIVVAGVVLAVAILVLWRACAGHGAPSGDAGTAAAGVTAPRSMRSAGGISVGEREGPVRFDEDPRGELRLEGQVVDLDELPVPGASVAIDSNPRRQVVTEHDGSFAFEGLVGRVYRVEARADARFAGPVWARVSAVSEPVVLRLAPSAQLEVTVLRDQPRQPVPGATVVLASIAEYSQTCDERGVARIVGIPAGSQDVRVSAPGLATVVRAVTIPAQATGVAKIEVVLTSGSTISGRVSTASGTPISGARVVAEPAFRARWERARSDLESRSGDDGRFEISGVGVGSYRVAASHPEYAPAFATVTVVGSRHPDDVELTMAEGGRIAGRVVSSAGEPVSSAAVRVGRQDLAFESEPMRQAYTDSEGKFAISGLPRTQLEVVALHETASSHPEQVNLAQQRDQLAVTLTLDVVGVISGIVVDDGGEPVAEAQVRAQPRLSSRRLDAMEMWRLRPPLAVLAGAGGEFVFRGVPEGTYRIDARRPAVWSDSAWQGKLTVDAGDERVRVVLHREGGVRGKVVTSAGDPPALFIVSLGDTSVPFRSADGTFELGGIAPGRHRVVVSGPGLVATASDEVELAGQVIDLGTITVDRGRTVRGRVLRADRSAVAGATVVADRLLAGNGIALETAFVQQSSMSGTDGSYSLAGLRSDAIGLVADHPSEGRSALVALAHSEADDRVDIVIARTGSLEGVVKREDKGITANLSAEPAREGVRGVKDPAVRFSVATGTDGSYRFDRLAPGRYVVDAQIMSLDARGAPAQSQVVDIRSDETTKADFSLTSGPTLVVAINGGNGQIVDQAAVVLALAVITVKTRQELFAALRPLNRGAMRMAKTAAGSVEFRDVAPGNYSLCGMADSASEESQPDDPVSCAPIAVTRSPDRQETILSLP